MTDQRLNLCPVTSEALHFADGVEEVGIDVVVLDSTPGLRSLAVNLRILRRVGGLVFYMEFMQLVSVDRNTRNSLVRWTVERAQRTYRQTGQTLPSFRESQDFKQL